VLASVALVLTTGVALAALVARAGNADMWSRFSNAGQAFGVLTAVLSGFALAALVITFWMQLQELQAQRTELCAQRELLSQAKAALHRSAAAEIRSLHNSLLKMAMDDDDLAAVWPTLRPGLSPTQNRQFLYANLILQHNRLYYEISDWSEPEMRNNIRYLFTNPVMRDYWRTTRTRRADILVPESGETLFDQIAEQIFQEHGDVPLSISGGAVVGDDLTDFEETSTEQAA
jgi:Family of unknown function (DUF6082)